MSTKGMYEQVRTIRNRAAGDLDAFDREFADGPVRTTVGDAYLAVGICGQRAERDADDVARTRRKLRDAIEAVYYATDGMASALEHARRQVKMRNGDTIF